MKTEHLQNIQLFETSFETGNLQSYDEQSIIEGLVASHVTHEDQIVTTETHVMYWR